MRKVWLLVILILNIIIFAFSGFVIYDYFFDGRPARILPPPEVKEVTVKKTEPATIKIISIPPEAKVFVNGFFKGRTPCEIQIVSAKDNGTFLLTLIKEGYQKWNREISLYSGEVKEYRIILKK